MPSIHDSLGSSKLSDHQSGLPSSLEVEIIGQVAVLRLRREHKRNALDDVTVLGIERFIGDLPPEAKVIVLDASGDHFFSAGLDLSSLSETSTFGGIAHSAMCHRVFQRIEFGTLPVIAVMKGAVVGGRLEPGSSPLQRPCTRTTHPPSRQRAGSLRSGRS